MKIVICGSRTFNNYEQFCSEMKDILDLRNKDTVILISGGAKGADTLARNYAEENGYKFEEYLADWDNLGKKAGYIRNVQMLEVADSVVAFWDGKSRGTAHMVKESLRRNIPLVVIDV